MRFRYASEDGRSEDRCDPTTKTGTGTLLEGEAKRGAGVAHHVGARRDYDAPGAPRDGLRDLRRNLPPVLWLEVFAVDADDYLRRDVRDVRELRHQGVQVLGRDGGVHGPGPVVDPAGYRPPGAEDRDEGEAVLGLGRGRGE